MSEVQRDDAPPKLGLFRRLSRSSGKGATALAMAPTSTAKQLVPDATPTNTSATSFPAKAKVTAFAKLKSQLGKRGKLSKVQFPPSSWNAERRVSTASQTTDILESTAVASTRDGSAENNNDGVDTSGDHISPPREDESQMMSPATLAHRIHSLLSSFPPFYSLTSSGSIRLPKSPSNQSDGEPDANAPLADSNLLSLLSSATAMNGSISKGRESVWAILERLGYNTKSEDKDKGGNAPGVSSDDDNVEVSSVMICCPLEPTDDTEVEIARSEVVSIDMEETTETAETPKEQKVGLNLWPFGKGKEKAEPAPSPKIKEVRVWFPSRTKVSLQAAWWGYRIYLPPPVMRVLSDKSLEAAKRAAMITAALSWLISHIPTAMLPPQLQAVVGIVKGIVPIIGYVGGFIAWSWSTVQGFDKGQGVILSATWLLPIALVPGTWNYTEPPPQSGVPVDGSTPAPVTPSVPVTPLPATTPAPPPKDPSIGIQPVSPS